MIVDDDSTSLAIGKALLESEYQVILMKSGLQALGYLKRNSKPDIILLDMIMPGTSGMDILKMIKKDENLCEIPVLFLTSMDDYSFEIEGFTFGAVDFIQKPVIPELLKLKIKRQIYILNLKRENRYLTDKLDRIKRQVDLIYSSPFYSDDESTPL